MEPRPCPSCERGTLTSRGGTGRFFPHRVFRELELPADVELPTCDFCGKIIFNPKVAVAFDEGMTRAFQAKLSQLISEALTVLTPGIITQQDLECKLGLSRGYISKLKGGKESSVPIAGLLGLLATDPQAQLRRLDAVFNGKRSASHTEISGSPGISITATARFDITSKRVPAGRRMALARLG